MSNIVGSTAEIALPVIHVCLNSSDADEALEEVAQSTGVSGDSVVGSGDVPGGFSWNSGNSTRENDLLATGSSPVTTPAKNPDLVSLNGVRISRNRKRETETLESNLLGDVVRSLVVTKALTDVELFSVNDPRCLDLKHLESLAESLCEAVGIGNRKKIASRSLVIAALMDYATKAAEGTLLIGLWFVYCVVINVERLLVNLLACESLGLAL